jgi:hypothetical protein
MNVLFLMRRYSMLRNFESTLRTLAERGHDVHLAFEQVKGEEEPPQDILGRLGEHRGFSWGHLPARRPDAWGVLADEARAALNYLRYLEPQFRDAEKLRERARVRAPRLVGGLSEHTPVQNRALRWVLDLALGARPADPQAGEYLDAHRPDLVVGTSLVRFRSSEPDYVATARMRGIATAYCVHSWDNLTNKGVIHGAPDVVLVWNEPQRREAIDLHGTAPDRVVATGAQTYDHWFDWRPSGSREEFCTRVGLRPDRPFLLYLCSSRKIAREEVEFVERWIGEVRSDPRMENFGVVVRPHPYHAEQWRGNDLSRLGEAAVWPRERIEPTDRASASDFFDSIFHSAAVVGVNTSALIETTIVGRPVLSLLAPEFEQSQEGTLHFDHLRPENGGPLTIASDFEEHKSQLAVALDPSGGAAERLRSFVSSFVRPRGLDVVATSVVVDVLEEAGRAPRPAVRPARAALTLALTPLAVAVRRGRDRRKGRGRKGALGPIGAFTSAKGRGRMARGVRRRLGRLAGSAGRG